MVKNRQESPFPSHLHNINVIQLIRFHVDSPMVGTLPEPLSLHAPSGEADSRPVFGPRVRRLHARIGKAHRQAEGMAFSKALLAGEGLPRQLAVLISCLSPAYTLLENHAPSLATALGAPNLPWDQLRRSEALRKDRETLAGVDAVCLESAAAADRWVTHLQGLASTSPHRFLAHAYVRYGGDLSGGQQLAEQANAILAAHQLPALTFWQFNRPVTELKRAFHTGFEELQLTPQQEEELLEEAVVAFHATQSLLASLEELN